ncbi:MAG: peptidylprolyl isomerase [Hormoscilla sp. GM102CHS1]|nr:peptidylprolyl isomerase [Hormoscilla sp. GM102CHS1]
MVEILEIGNKVVKSDEILSLLTRYQLMPQLVRGLLIDQALAEVTCTEEERSQAIAAVEGHMKITDPEAKAAWLESQGMTSSDLEEIAVRPLLLEKFKQANWHKKVESYFLTRKTNLDQVVYSLIRTKDMGLAQEIYFRIKEAEQSFADLAREHSQGAEAHTDGLLGPVPISQPHPTLAKILSVSKPGQLWPPRKLGEWFVVVRLEKMIPVQLDDGMRRKLMDELFEKWLWEEIQKKGQIKRKDQKPQAQSDANAPIYLNHEIVW